MSEYMNYFIVGGAGFIGSHVAITILKEDPTAGVTVFDNFSSGRKWHLQDMAGDNRLRIIQGDVIDKDGLSTAMKGADVVYHFASNPDIAKAMTQPDIDFWEGTYLTNNVLEAMRISGVRQLLYASGSGIYGDTGSTEIREDHSPLIPISTYGASKLAGEALICSYCHMFEVQAAAFRFANVVGPHQTHGVGYDFLRRLLKNPAELAILGDGTQSKSYIYVTDVVSAMRRIEKHHLAGFSYFNVATLDFLSVTDIADIVIDILKLPQVKRSFTGGNRGWKGDVPVVRLNSDKIRSLGWSNRYTTREAITQSVESMRQDAIQNRFQQE